MKTQILKITLLASLLLFCSQFVFGQNALPAPPTCDQVLSSTKAAMQKEANATCKTVTRCVACTDKKLGQVLYATMVVNPIAAECNVKKAEPSGAVTAERGKVAMRAPEAATVGNDLQFQSDEPVFEILQSRCEDGSGIDVSAYIPGNAAQCRSDQYSYLWEIDGGKGGHAPQMNCACGTSVQLTLTNIKTGKSLTKKVALLPCGKQ